MSEAKETKKPPVELIGLRRLFNEKIALVKTIEGTRPYTIEGLRSIKEAFRDDPAAQGGISHAIASIHKASACELLELSSDDAVGQLNIFAS